METSMSMLQNMWALLTSRWDFFGGLLLEHIKISFAAVIIAIIVGGITGILISHFQRTAKPTLAVINFLYTIPSISMLGFLIPFSGIGNATAVIALTVYALLPMVINTHTGLTNIDPLLVEAAEGMGSTTLQTLVKIKIPLALPVIMSGIRSMTVMTIALGGIASFIGAGGLGVAIYRGITTNNSAMTMDGSLLIAFLALTVDFLLGCIEKRMKLRSAEAHKHNKIAGIVGVILTVITAVALFLPFGQKETINIATKPMTEQYILGEALKELIEHKTNLKVNLTQGVGGGTSNIQPGMEKGSFDIYPEYTGTGWNLVLKNTDFYSTDKFSQLQSEYRQKYNMDWLGMYGFENTFGLAVRKDIAQKYNLQTYSDLARVSGQLTFGGEYDFFEREDGYTALCAAYGMTFKNTVDLDIGLKYEAMSQGKIDAMIVFTTDGKLNTANVVILKDDRHFFASYQAGNVVRSEVLQKHPELKDLLDSLTNTITNEDMARMNYEVETNGREPKDVAHEYLVSKGLV